MKTSLRLVVVGAGACVLAAYAWSATGSGAITRPARPVVTTSTSTSSTSSSTTTSTTTSSTTTTTVPGTGQLWTGKTLTVTPVSVGAVHVGMSLEQASRAAGEKIIEVGDGAAYAQGGSYYVGPAFVDTGSNGVSCVGAGAGSGKTIATAEGFELGESVRRLKQIYGERLIFMPEPPTGMQTIASYVVEEPSGYLAFWLDDEGSVSAIVGNPGQLDRADAYAGSIACIA